MIFPYSVESLHWSKNYRSTAVSDDGRYLIINITPGIESLVFYADLRMNGEITGKIHLTQLVSKLEALYVVSNKLNSWFSNTLRKKIKFFILF